MELAEPAVIGKAGFLRWILSALLGSHEILAENDASLQLSGARILHVPQVDEAALVPVFGPVGGGGLAPLGKRLPWGGELFFCLHKLAL